MKPHIVSHLANAPIPPVLDVLGKWVCVPNAKTATTSITGSVLADRQVLKHRGGRNWQRVWDHIIVPQFDDLFLFTFVRNSWDRTISAFQFLQQAGHIELKWKFRDYVKAVLAVKGTSVNRHFTEQSPTFLFKGQMIPGMFVGRFEQLREDFAYVAGRLEISKDLPHRNASKHDHYTSYYDTECIEIVRKIYAEEINALNYEYDE